MRTSLPIRLPSDEHFLVEEGQIFRYLSQKQRRGSGIMVFFRSGRQFKMSNYSEIAQCSPGGWFSGIVKDGRLKGVVFLAHPNQFLFKRAEIRGYQLPEVLDRLDESARRRKLRQAEEHGRKVRLAHLNGDLRRVRELYATGSHEESTWLELVIACGSACLRCGGSPITKDHVVPLSRGGGNSLSNLQPLCGSCNSWKGTKSLDFRDHSCQKITDVFRRHGVPCPSPSGEGQPRHDDAGPAGPPTAY